MAVTPRTAPHAGTSPQQQRMTPRDINALYKRLDMTFLSEDAVSKPSKIYAAVSVVCDLECPYCPRQHYSREHIGHGLFPEKQFDAIAPYAAHAEHFELFGLGEPFLHPRFFEFLRRVKHSGGPAALSSHGMSLSDEVIERIITERLDRIAVSMDAPSARLFNFLRRGADFETVCANVKKLVRRKRERGSPTPRVVIACTVSRHNLRGLERMSRLAAELGADGITFADMGIVSPGDAHLSVRGHPAFARRLKRAMEQARRLGLTAHHHPQFPYLWIQNEEAQPPPGRYGCMELWQTYSVSRKGRVLPCCWLDEDFGNAFEEDLDALVNHPTRRRFRRGIMDGTPHPTCGACPYFQRNSAARVTEILDDLERDVQDPRLPEEHRRRLTGLLAEYRAKARTFFPPARENSGSEMKP